VVILVKFEHIKYIHEGETFILGIIHSNIGENGDERLTIMEM